LFGPGKVNALRDEVRESRGAAPVSEAEAEAFHSGSGISGRVVKGRNHPRIFSMNARMEGVLFVHSWMIVVEAVHFGKGIQR
jgi:hypothetical protein